MTQEEALDILKLGHNVYLTGPAGSGKTYVLSRYVSFLRERGVRVAVTASTGIAATHIEGATIHSWSGIGVKDSISEYDL
jgi:Ni2+-binding GTPase involved in maturation of urease and hydrogenase